MAWHGKVRRRMATAGDASMSSESAQAAEHLVQCIISLTMHMHVQHTMGSNRISVQTSEW